MMYSERIIEKSMMCCCMRMLDSQAFLIPKGTMCFLCD